MTVDIVVLIALAVFLFFKLRGQLGNVNGQEDALNRRENIKKFMKEKVNPNEQSCCGPAIKFGMPKKQNTTSQKAKDLGLEIVDGGQSEEEIKKAEEKARKEAEIKFIDEKDEDIYNSVNTVLSKAEITIGDFITGANGAFEMITESFAKEDRKALKMLLSKDIYARFEQDMDSRLEDNKMLETTLISSSPIIKNATIKNGKAEVEIIFTSEQINLVKDRDGNIHTGDNKTIENISETWTLGRDLKSKDFNWKVINIK